MRHLTTGALNVKLSTTHNTGSHRTLDDIQATAVRRIDEYVESHELENASDVLADVMHWAEATGEDFEELLRQARAYYEAESA